MANIQATFNPAGSLILHSSSNSTVPPAPILKGFKALQVGATEGGLHVHTDLSHVSGMSGSTTLLSGQQFSIAVEQSGTFSNVDRFGFFPDNSAPDGGIWADPNNGGGIYFKYRSDDSTITLQKIIDKAAEVSEIISFSVTSDDDLSSLIDLGGASYNFTSLTSYIYLQSQGIFPGDFSSNEGYFIYVESDSLGNYTNNAYLYLFLDESHPNQITEINKDPFVYDATAGSYVNPNFPNSDRPTFDDANRYTNQNFVSIDTPDSFLFVDAAADDILSEAEDSAAENNVFEITLNDIPGATLSLIGDEQVFIAIDDTYQDPGATYTDIFDGTGTIYSSDLLDTSSDGVFTLNYSYTNSQGIVSSTISRTVTVETTNYFLADRIRAEKIYLDDRLLNSDLSSMHVHGEVLDSNVSSLHFRDLGHDSDISSLDYKDEQIDSDISSMQAMHDYEISSLHYDVDFKDLDLDSDVSSLIWERFLEISSLHHDIDVKDLDLDNDISSLIFVKDNEMSSLHLKDLGFDSDISSLQEQRVDDVAALDSDISSLQEQRVDDVAALDSDISSLQEQRVDDVAALDSDVSSLQEQRVDDVAALDSDLSSLQELITGGFVKNDSSVLLKKDGSISFDATTAGSDFSNRLAISMWVKLTDKEFNGDSILETKNFGSTNIDHKGQLQLSLQNSAGDPSLKIRSLDAETERLLAQNQEPMILHGWNHILMLLQSDSTSPGSDGLQLFLNGNKSVHSAGEPEGDFVCSDVALHIQSDTTDGSTTFTDLSGNNEVNISSPGNSSPSHTTDQPHLGTTSIDFTGAGNRLEVGDNTTKANFKFLHDKSSNYTIEGWMYRNSDSNSSDTVLSNAGYTANYGIRLRFISADKLTFTICHGELQGTGTKSFEATTATTIPKNQWVHYAICYDGTNITCYINGSSSDGFTKAWANSAAETQDPSQILWIGARDGGGQDRFDGYMQDIRISKKALYAQDFTRPSALLVDVCSLSLQTFEDLNNGWSIGGFKGFVNEFAILNLGSSNLSESEIETLATTIWGGGDLYDFSQDDRTKVWWRMGDSAGDGDDNKINNAIDATTYQGTMNNLAAPYGIKRLRNSLLQDIF